MFKSLKMNLKNKLTDSEELTKIQNKLHSFYEQNPEVDHYVSDGISRKITIGMLLGFFIGFAFALFVFVVWAWFQLDILHAQGYLNIPGSFLWG